MQVRKFPIQPSALLKMPEKERAFFLLAGHILNELNSLNKVFTWCLQNQSGRSELESVSNVLQAHLYARLLAGKLFEAWEALRKSFFGAHISKEIEGLLKSSAQESLGVLKDYFNKKNVISRVRNSLAFHYDAEEFERNWLKVSENSNFSVILGDTIGNNVHLASELVANMAVFCPANQDDESIPQDRFLDEVQSMANHFNFFLEGVVVFFLESVLPQPIWDQCTVEDIAPEFRFEDIALPHFCNYGRPDA